MYRLTVLKQGPYKLHTTMTDTIGGQRFRTEMLPLDGSVCADYFVKHPVDLLLVDLCGRPARGLDFLRALRLKGVKSEIVAYIARDDCRTLRRVMRLGVADCLVDPFDTSRFEQAVERFLQRRRIFASPQITQEQADGLKRSAQPVSELPKGLQKRTLNTIRALLSSRPGASFSCGDVVGAVNLSRITVQRYLSYMSEAGELIEAVNYSTGGRPCSLYQYNPGLFA